MKGGLNKSLKVLVLGSGLMGTAVVEHLISSGAKVAVGDRSRKALNLCVDRVKYPKLETFQIDVTDHNAMVKLLKGGDFDVVVNALPYYTIVSVLKAEVEAGINVVDMEFDSRQMELKNKVAEAGITVVPGCGNSPGLSNMLVGYAMNHLNRVERVRIFAGGLPQKPIPPLEYRILFNVEGLWFEYTQKARVVFDGKVEEVDALSGIELIEFPSVGTLEAFYTDGLGSLIHTFKEKGKLVNVKEMFEKTLRYPGHARKIKTLMECGLLDTEPLEFKGGKIAPRDFLTTLLTPKLELGDEKDIMIVRVEVIGDNGLKKYTFDLIDYYDETRKITAMARTAAYTASIVAQLIGLGKIDDKGIVPPEELGARSDILKLILEELSKYGIKIKSTHTEISPVFSPVPSNKV